TLEPQHLVADAAAGEDVAVGVDGARARHPQREVAEAYAERAGIVARQDDRGEARVDRAQIEGEPVLELLPERRGDLVLPAPGRELARLPEHVERLLHAGGADGGLKKGLRARGRAESRAGLEVRRAGDARVEAGLGQGGGNAEADGEPFGV